MEKNFPVSFIRLEGIQSSKLNDIRAELVSKKYNDEAGFGFTNVSGSLDYLSATLLKRTPTFIPQIEIDTWNIVQREIFLYSEIDFEIDYSFSLLEIFGASKNIPKVTAYIFPLLGKIVKVNPIQFTALEVFGRLNNSHLLKSVDRLVVNNFHHLDGISGRYDMRIDKPSLGYEIINQYHQEISRLVMVVNLEKVNQIKLTVSRNGSLLLRCEESDFSDALEQIKNCLFLEEEQ